MKAPKTHPLHVVRRIFHESPAAIVLGAVSGLAASLLRLGFRWLQWCFTHNGVSPAVAAASLLPVRRFLIPVIGALCAIVVLVLRRRNARRLGREPRHYVEYVEAVRREHGHIPLTEPLANSVGCVLGRVRSQRGTRRLDDPVRRRGHVLVPGARAQPSYRPSAAGSLTCRGVRGRRRRYDGVHGSCRRRLFCCGDRARRVLSRPASATCLGSSCRMGRRRRAAWPGTSLPHTRAARRFMDPLAAAGAGTRDGSVWSGVSALAAQPSQRAAAASCACDCRRFCGRAVARRPRVWGNGDAGLSAALGHPDIRGLSIGASSLGVLFVLRMLATTFCVGAGTVGGVFTPTLFAGGSLGALAAYALLHFGVPANPTLFAIVGMSALIGAATHAPVMAACIAVELTGDWRLLPGLLVLDVVGWLVARKLSRDALYAIASQTPVHKGLAPPHRFGWSARRPR